MFSIEALGSLGGEHGARLSSTVALLGFRQRSSGSPAAYRQLAVVGLPRSGGGRGL